MQGVRQSDASAPIATETGTVEGLLRLGISMFGSCNYWIYNSWSALAFSRSLSPISSSIHSNSLKILLQQRKHILQNRTSWVSPNLVTGVLTGILFIIPQLAGYVYVPSPSDRESSYFNSLDPQTKIEGGPPTDWKPWLIILGTTIIGSVLSLPFGCAGIRSLIDSNKQPGNPFACLSHGLKTEYKSNNSNILSLFFNSKLIPYAGWSIVEYVVYGWVLQNVHFVHHIHNKIQNLIDPSQNDENDYFDYDPEGEEETGRPSFIKDLIQNILHTLAVMTDDAIYIVTVTFLTSPFKTILANMIQSPEKYATCWGAVGTIMSEEGMKGFWKGFVPHLLGKFLPVLLVSGVGTFILNYFFGIPNPKKHGNKIIM